MNIRVDLGTRGYDIAISTGNRSNFVPFVFSTRDRLTSAFVLTDDNAESQASPLAHMLDSAGVKTRYVSLPPGEASKSQEMLARIYDELADFPADRQTLFVAIGGGVIGDLGGFAAATWNRGMPLLMVPTTLLAMVDSSVGGKTGINHPSGKNLIGSFHQPTGVWIDTDTLETLPVREYLSGLAEVVKYGMILDPELFVWLEQNADSLLKRDPEAVCHIVSRSCRLKADVVEKDEREELGLRIVLNYGHTFAHAFENVSGYGTWLHGEAVSAGMICASRLAEKRGLIDSIVTMRQRRLLQQFGLPIAPLMDWAIPDLIRSMYRDKKAEHGKLRFVLPKKIGEVATFADIPESQVRDVLAGN